MDVGFLIIGPDRNVAGLRNTLGSIHLYSRDRSSVFVVGNDATESDMKDFKVFCPTYKGKDTITSLVNLGMKKIKNEWACIIFAGSRIPSRIEQKWDAFCKKESDVLYSVVDGKYNFVEGSFNGVLINTKFFAKVGEFPTATMKKYGLNDFEFVKMLWASDAVDQGANFKGIVGMRVI